MFNPVCADIDKSIIISNERFAELVRKEERLSIIERMVEKNNYVGVEDIKTILNMKVKESAANG